jgi:transcriptional regulator with XRE-family HTH domain
MNSCVTVQDVATAAGVNRSTVSRVLSGKAAQGRISPDTQNRIRSIASQLGYQAGAFVRYRAAKPLRGNLNEQPPTAGEAERRMGLILAPDSPASSLSFIPSLVPPMATAGYELVIVTIPADPIAARKRMRQLIDEGVTGLFCCPSVYAAALEVAGSSKPLTPAAFPATRTPVIVLWQGAGKAMLAAVGSQQLAVGSQKDPQVFIPTTSVPPPVVASPPPVAPKPPVVATEPPTKPVSAPAMPDAEPPVSIPAAPTPPLPEPGLPEDNQPPVPSTDSEPEIPIDAPPIDGAQLVFDFLSFTSPRNLS